jgi:hypothetical protein
MLVRKKSIHELYTNNIQLKNIQPIIKDIRIDKNQSYINMRIQFPIQLATIKTIHQSQGLSLDEFTFDHTNVKKTWTIIHNCFSHSNKRKILFLNFISTSQVSH